jgi:hypothetical protein
MAGTLPPIFVISDDEHGGYAAVALYTLLTLTVIIVATRLSARYYIGKIIQTDDYLITSATVRIKIYPSKKKYRKVPRKNRLILVSPSGSSHNTKCVCAISHQSWPRKEAGHSSNARFRSLRKGQFAWSSQRIFVSAQRSHIWVIVHICGADPDHLGAGAQQDLDCPPLQELNDKGICILVGFGLDRRHCRLGSRLDLRASVPMCDAHALGYHWPLSEPGEFVVDPLPVEIFFC